MTARTRYFALGSGLVLAIGLGTALVAYYVGTQATPPAAVSTPSDAVP